MVKYRDLTKEDRILEFLQTREIQIQKDIVEGRNYHSIDFRDILDTSPEFTEEIINNFNETETTFNQLIQHLSENKIKAVLFHNAPIPKTAIKDLRKEHLNQLTKIEGIIRRATPVNIKINQITIECNNCATQFTIPQTTKYFYKPNKCRNCKANTDFTILKQNETNWQRAEIEELPEQMETIITSRINIYIEEPLTDPHFDKRIIPGTKVQIIGTYTYLPSFLQNKKSTTPKTIIKANNIQILETEYEEIKLSNTDIQQILKESKNPKLYQNFAESIAPHIYGNKELKKAIVLQIFGGTRQPNQKVRDRIHILMTGDPSTAKSYILEYLKTIAPKCRWATGGKSSKAGLTAAIVKDELTGQFVLEAGAAVYAHKGIFLLDEIDEMNAEDRASMHEIMEQGTVTKTGASINATLPAETSILGAANPKKGRFDDYEPLPSQINLPPTLLSRFDAIFAMKDVPEPEQDKKIASHILKYRTNPESIKPPYPTNFIKKYVVYAKKNIMPKWTKKANAAIKKFYLKLRQQSISDQGIRTVPIGARQLNAMQRFAEASAKMRLSKKVEEQDTQRAIQIMNHYLLKLGLDKETGRLDIDRITSSVTASMRSHIATIKGILEDLRGKTGDLISINEVIKIAGEKDIRESQVEEVIEKMKNAGDIFEPRRGFIQTI